MRRTAVLMSVLLCLLLVGCRTTRESDRRFTVSALGFDVSGSDLVVSAEALVVNSESTKEEITKKLFTAQGKDAADCIFKLKQKIPKDIQLAHCTVVALGDTVEGKALDKVIDYCAENREINLSTHICTTANAQQLLSGEAASTLTVGYELAGYIEHAAAQTGVTFKSRLYQVQSARLAPSPAFVLPRFSAEEDGCTLIGGTKVQKNRKAGELSLDEVGKDAK